MTSMIGLMQSASFNWINGEPAPTREHLECRNPATGMLITPLARGQASDVDAAVRAAQAAAPAWGARSFEDRAAILDRIADGIEAHIDVLASIESQDQGKPVSLAKRIDIPRAVANFRFFAGAVRHQELPSHRMPDALNFTTRSPVGVCGLITPWNLPLYLLTWKLAPALAMGNTVVAKPSELSPLSAAALAVICKQAGLPDGVFNLVHGLGPEAGQAIVGHPDIKLISFTGGTATGVHVAGTAAPMFKKLSLELGGKNATLVFADADLDKAVDGAVRAAFTNQGEICLCGSRVLIERSIYAEFERRFVAQVKALKVGDPADPETDVGALNSLPHRDKVAGYVDLAREEGAQVLCGGSVPELGPDMAGGAFFSPTVLAGLPTDSRCATEEIFGPVVTLHPFDSEDEAVSAANGTRYGLSASLWTTDLNRAHRVSAALQVGMVWVNTWLKRDLRTPFGGTKDSGVGREGGRWSLEFYSESKNICIQL